MSFWPFPKTLLAELTEGASRGRVLEVGAGRGDLARRLRTCVEDVLTMDVDPFAPVDVRADLRALPFAAASLSVVVFGDVLRHLESTAREDAARESARVLTDDGRAIVLEDHPEGRDRAEVNYREALALLADVATGRGPAQSVERLTSAWPSRLGPAIVSGQAENVTEVSDPTAPLRWLRGAAGHDRTLRARIDDLAASVDAHGMRYGRFAYAVFRRGSSG